MKQETKHDYVKRNKERENEQVVNDDGNGKSSAGGSVVGGGDVFDARR
jgi:hypothetical protein